MGSVPLIGYIEKDYLEAKEVFIIGGLRSNNVNVERLTIIGCVNVKNLLLTHDLLIIGGGRIRELTGENIIISASDAPFFIDKLKAKKAYLLGEKYPIIIHDVFALSAFLEHTLVSKMKSKKIIFSSRTRIKTLSDCKELYFTDPHVYIEKLLCNPEKHVFKYETARV